MAGRRSYRPAGQAQVPLLLLVVVVGLSGANVRAALGSVPPLLPAIQSDLDISNAQGGLITSLAVLSIGVCAPLGQRLGARIGPERATAWCMAVLCVAQAARIMPAGIAALYLTTLATGAAMGAASAMIPALVSEHAGKARGLTLGCYSTGMALGVALAAAVALPLERALGGWRAALAALAAPAALGTVLWVMVMVRGRPAPVRCPDAPAFGLGLPWRSRTARLLAALFTSQMLVGFGCLAWISPLYVSLGESKHAAAGLLVVFQVVQLATMLGLPMLADRMIDRRPLVAFAAICCCGGLVLLLTVPVPLAVPAVALCGLGVGGGSTLAMLLIVDATASVVDGARVMAMALMVGSSIGAASPLLLGAAKDLTGGFTPGLAGLLVVSLGMLWLTRAFRPGLRL